MASPTVACTASPQPHKPNESKPKTFAQVLSREMQKIQGSRQGRNVNAPVRADNLTGLAFSGGGIRSATFSLGVLQALAEKGLLHQFDYLSTVSGGGYIGSWMAALALRLKETGKSFDQVEAALSPHKYEPDQLSEPPVLHWLRLYSNYLTPHKGAISGDTWAMVGTWMRNVLLNQTILGLMFVSVFVACLSAVLPLVLADNDGMGFLATGGLLLFAASVSMAIDVIAEAPSTRIRQTAFQRVRVTVTVMLPFVVACVLLNCGLWQRTDYGAEPTWMWMIAGAAFYFVVWGLVAILAKLRRLARKRRGKPKKIMVSIPALVVFSPLAGAAGGCLFRSYVLLLNHLPSGITTSTSWVVVVFGSGILMAIIMLTGTLHVGLVGRGSMDVVREWWARLGGYLTLMTLGWLLLAGTCVFGPLAVRWGLFELQGWKSVSVGLLWVLHNYLGLKAASSGKTSGKASSVAKSKKDGDAANCEDEKGQSKLMKALKSPRVLDTMAKVAPYVFIVGLVLLLSTAIQIATGLVVDFDDTAKLWAFKNGMNWFDLSEQYWAVLEMGSAVWLAGLGAIFFLAGLGLSWRVDVNEFSLHHFYRNRLVRCYLGASNPKRTPEPFTGFDPNDDVPLTDFAGDYPGPYPILNAALNITGGEELGYATRRAKSFVFTPLYCGYELGSPGEGALRFSCDEGFLPSYSRTVLGRAVGGVAKFGCECGISLGTAMAISGAAASPNMGYFTTPATAFYMALFDVRLGWWMGNPRDPKSWRSSGPALGLGYLLSEVLGQSDQQKKYVYLSDGGHFENLAVYELIRRRCRLIVACDGDCDPQFEFGNLLSLIEKARTDFGARIEIDYEKIRPMGGARESGVNHVVGTIYYDSNNRNDKGTLIFIKASLPKKEAARGERASGERGLGEHVSREAASGEAASGEPAEWMLPDDVWQYAKLQQSFPHQSTADQWFDELQFESYRALGEYIGCHATRDVRDAMVSTLGDGPAELQRPA